MIETNSHTIHYPRLFTCTRLSHLALCSLSYSPSNQADKLKEEDDGQPPGMDIIVVAGCYFAVSLDEWWVLGLLQLFGCKVVFESVPVKFGIGTRQLLC